MTDTEWVNTLDATGGGTTPRTEAALCRVAGLILDLLPFGPVVPAEFARGLERELAAATGSNIQRPQPELAILDVINAVRAIVTVMHAGIMPLDKDDAETLLNLMADAEAKLQLP